ncbi:MAG: hypothetical protein HS115_08550 [Spirochaetales bacterium]|nr:hypothetical protein [Spirochaetales bacterium]
MSLFIGQLQKNIFAITLIASALLGTSLAYLASVILNYVLLKDNIAATVRGERRSEPTVSAQAAFRSLSEFEGIVPGNFVRGVVVATGPGGEEGAGGEITVLGTIGGDPSFARAAIQITGEQEIKEYRVGQSVAGYKLISIRSNSILAERGGSQVNIPVGVKSGEVSAAPQAAAQPAAAAGTTRVIQRAKFLALANNPAALYQAKFAPVTKDNKIVGVKLLLVPENNFLYEMGARTGDILRRINGQPLENPEKLYQMWSSIKDATQFSVEIERAGQVLPFEIKIQ